MQTVANPSLSISIRAVGISIILLFLVGVAMLLGWSPSSSGHPVDSAIAAEPSPTLAREAVVAKCAGCGVIEETRVVEMANDAIAAGAAIGGALGNQMGGDRGKGLLSLFGAMGAAASGNEIRQRVPSGKRYESTVRFDNGATRVFSETSPPRWQAGDRVKVIDGAIQLHG